ncbi:hypothetical protein [Lutibacter sp.]|uniref:hypothetical protein n=1 Tax=Lutibacter sp. TaxID=1925666 RepID=UPI002734E463|nr:hypothetical protein [Lutibacter sp.]MDP3313778.1 hypothetical protein [Lutibacter sp.]
MKNLKLTTKSKYFLYALLCVVFLGSCDIGNRKKLPLKKPFIITYKYPRGSSCNDGFCSYEFTDANNNKVRFCEEETMYKIGDSIK